MADSVSKGVKTISFELVLSVASMLVILIAALFYFKRIDGKIADYV